MGFGIRGALRRALIVAVMTLAVPGAATAHAAITVANVTVEEGQPAVFLLKTDQLTGSETVLVTTVEGSATDPEDYTGVMQQLEVASGPGRPVPIPTVQDSVPEADEQFTLEVDPVGPGETQRATGTIRNDDPPPLVGVVRDVREGATTQTVSLALLVPSTKTVTVRVSTADGTARGGEDFTPISTTVTFPAGEQVRDVAIPLGDDGVYEGDETYGVRLTEVVNATLVADALPATILENEPVPTLTLLGPPPLAEGDSGTTPAPVTLRLSGPVAMPALAAVVTERGTATSPADFEALAEVVTFAPGEVEKAVVVAIKGDDKIESDEQFRVLAGGIAHITTGAEPAAVSVTIRNDDRDTVAPKMSVGSPKLRGRELRSKIRCPRDEIRCTGTVTFFKDADRRAEDKSVRQERRLGRVKFELAGGKAKTMRKRLGPKNLRLLRSAGRPRISVYVVATDAEGNRRATRKRARIRVTAKTVR